MTTLDAPTAHTCQMVRRWEADTRIAAEHCAALGLPAGWAAHPIDVTVDVDGVAHCNDICAAIRCPTRTVTATVGGSIDATTCARCTLGSSDLNADHAAVTRTLAFLADSVARHERDQLLTTAHRAAVAYTDAEAVVDSCTTIDVAELADAVRAQRRRAWMELDRHAAGVTLDETAGMCAELIFSAAAAGTLPPITASEDVCEVISEHTAGSTNRSRFSIGEMNFEQRIDVALRKTGAAPAVADATGERAQIAGELRAQTVELGGDDWVLVVAERTPAVAFPLCWPQRKFRSSREIFRVALMPRRAAHAWAQRNCDDQRLGSVSYTPGEIDVWATIARLDELWWGIAHTVERSDLADTVLTVAAQPHKTPAAA